VRIALGAMQSIDTKFLRQTSNNKLELRADKAEIAAHLKAQHRRNLAVLSRGDVVREDEIRDLKLIRFPY
jgi:hypothetical protein